MHSQKMSFTFFTESTSYYSCPRRSGKNSVTALYVITDLLLPLKPLSIGPDKECLRFSHWLFPFPILLDIFDVIYKLPLSRSWG